MQAGWSVRVICDTRIAASVKGKVYKMAVRPAVMDDLETVLLTKRIWLGAIRTYRVRNENIKATVRFGHKAREESLR